MVDATITEALEKVKTNYKEVNVAQRRYGYSQGSRERAADRDLVLAVLNAPRFLVLDVIVESPRLLSMREILDCQVDVDNDCI